LTIGAAVQTIDASNKASDEEYQQLEAAYSLGALGVGISYTQVENVNGAAGTDEDQLMVRLSSKL
jgi:prolyl-tRNA synthetase